MEASALHLDRVADGGDRLAVLGAGQQGGAGEDDRQRRPELVGDVLHELAPHRLGRFGRGQGLFEVGRALAHPSLELGDQPALLPLEVVAAAGVGDVQQQLAPPHGLEEVAVGAGGQRRLRHVGVVDAADHDDRDGPLPVDDRSGEGQSVLLAEADVHQRHVHLDGIEDGEGTGPVAGFVARVALGFEDDAEEASGVDVVVDQQHLGHR